MSETQGKRCIHMYYEGGCCYCEAKQLLLLYEPSKRQAGVSCINCDLFVFDDLDSHKYKKSK